MPPPVSPTASTSASAADPIYVGPYAGHGRAPADTDPPRLSAGARPRQPRATEGPHDHARPHPRYPPRLRPRRPVRTGLRHDRHRPERRTGLAGSIELARLADRRGFTRYWTNEHHAMPGVSTSRPPVLLSRLTAATSRLRLGVGGIMLRIHPPLVVAEQFGMLDALAPGRIDLGLGRAPARTDTERAALRRRSGAGPAAVP
ncbi:LLM class flavin-dependent oxidoreductase [Streptomyces sp. NPDC058308]|uniref:LLM class flavin-dependent oxidoreductase n=1 Tax=Streptomyces sp. NPDC058308 TaxID=3346440 RepID=UPI0036ED07EF